MNAAFRTSLHLFVFATLLLGCFASSTASGASTTTTPDLMLTLDGPFVVCDTGGNTLTVLVPNVIENPSPNPSGVDVSHYPPGFSGTLSEISLADKDNNQPSPKTFQLLLPGYSAAKTQVVSDELARIDQWNIPSTMSTGCSQALANLSSPQLYAVLTIPKPDILVGLLPDQVRIKRKDSTGKPLGPQDTDLRSYATQLQLVYKSTTTKGIRLCQGDPKDALLFWPKSSPSAKCTPGPTQNVAPLFRVVDGRISLTFDMQRKQDDPGGHNNAHHEHAKYVNDVIGTLVGISRNLDFQGFNNNMVHGDCMSPSIVICSGPPTSGSQTICTSSN